MNKTAKEVMEVSIQALQERTLGVWAEQGYFKEPTLAKFREAGYNVTAT